MHFVNLGTARLFDKRYLIPAKSLQLFLRGEADLHLYIVAARLAIQHSVPFAEAVLLALQVFVQGLITAHQ